MEIGVCVHDAGAGYRHQYARANVTPKTVIDYDFTFRLLKEVLDPDTPVRRITRDDSGAFGLGVVKLVTPRGGVLVREHDSHRPSESLGWERWVAFNRIDGHLVARARTRLTGR